MPNAELRRQERRKFDRHQAYIWFHIGVLFVALGIVLSPEQTGGVISNLTWNTQQLLGVCMLLGSGSGILGMVLGSRILRPDSNERPLDLRIPYGFGLAGLLGIAPSMWVYFVTILQNSTVIGTLGGGLSFAFGCMSITLSYQFAHQIVARTKIRHQIIRDDDVITFGKRWRRR